MSRDVAVRAAKTFVQTFLATLVAALGSGNVADLAIWQRAALAALAAGLSAAMNALKGVTWTSAR
ncbi:MAG: hypothetical protein KatS3mg014_2522 [Actinomycetota bacterium]|nr:MAG: hypothetical protein KatS3mg014_2483 [Actinomycetota bacterium]GIV00907.1 MAG: hypothetical protein KatS3mg014_2522 [Actinomycetota bacterium]